MTDDGPKMLNRPVVGKLPPYAYACGHPFPNGANMASTKCPACREEDAQKAAGAGST